MNDDIKEIKKYLSKGLTCRFFAYQFENLKTASDWRENGLLIVAVILGIVRAACWWFGVEIPYEELVKKCSEYVGALLALVPNHTGNATKFVEPKFYAYRHFLWFRLGCKPKCPNERLC